MSPEEEHRAHNVGRHAPEHTPSACVRGASLLPRHSFALPLSVGDVGPDTGESQIVEAEAGGEERLSVAAVAENQAVELAGLRGFAWQALGDAEYEPALLPLPGRVEV